MIESDFDLEEFLVIFTDASNYDMLIWNHDQYLSGVVIFLLEGVSCF